MTLMEPIKPATSAGITCTVADLRRAVIAAASIVQRRNTIPVLSCLRITPRDGLLEIEATDLDSWLTVDCDATCAAADPFLLDAFVLRALLVGAETSDSISIDRAADIVTMRIGPTTIRLRLLIDAADWPAEPGTDGMIWSDVPETALAKMIDSVRWAISTEETRYYLNGIYMHGRDRRLAGAATDGHRLALYQTDADWPLPDLIFPRHSVAALRSLLTAGGNRHIRVGGSTKPAMRLVGSGWTLFAKCIDGTYPDYTRVIPVRSAMRGHAVINRALLRRFPNPNVFRHVRDGIKFDLENRIASLSSVSFGPEVEARIEADGDFSIGFNQSYVREAVQNFGTVRIEASTSRDAALLLTEDPDLTVVLMPLRM
ncbi:DNA polymerase-3 subunit beta [Paracoccus pantotrophus]|uniref:Beta sliding clamp n=1 Tax=Paracoccus pantotrophus TaxID=82367 RepID=A0AAE6TUS9_PARPN|nr:DNA polymerase III subunit beta [Paracoccus pantotrophus]QFG38326.1 DNA polymerase III subunit beta [Paracoccus pantotrophus]RKS51155.1 DNA polymerase-3 subunit beta [Paracoccus pantotrophus]